MRVAGIMSGTSLDGIDVAVIDIARGGVRVVAHSSVPYSSKVRERLLSVSNAVTHIAEVSRLNFLLPELYAKAVRRCGVPLDTIQLVGCHGQTIFHESGNTLQIGDGSVLAELLGLPVVSDFRTRDIAAGGQGAPLVPFVDYMLFRHKRIGRVILNVGGIANLTSLPPGAPPDRVIAFDTGPGNMVVDQLVSLYTSGKQLFDKDGQFAAAGKVHQNIIDHLLRQAFFKRKPPKSAGREQYGSEFVAKLRSSPASLLDLIATATAFTAAAVAFGIERWVEHPVHELIVGGGGVRNATLMSHLGACLPGTRVRTTSDFGIDSDAKEAVAFAVLAYETWKKRPSNVPSATGARRAVVLGRVSF